MADEENTIFAVGDEIEFNKRGMNAQVNLPPPRGSSWKVVRIIPQANRAAPHPQLIDLGDGYAIGPVSGMFLKRKE